jgi:hypothetical protein
MASRNATLSLISVFLLLALWASTIDAHGLKGAVTNTISEEAIPEEIHHYHRQLFGDQFQSIVDFFNQIVSLVSFIQQIIDFFNGLGGSTPPS